MSQTPRRNAFTFGGSAVYRIVVSGSIDAGASDCLGGMRVNTTSGEGDEPVTTLVGPLKDQAQLAGVLNTIYEMHLPVLEVKKLDGE
jgi:hypothetical protein